MSSGSVSSLNAGESQVIQHNGEDYPDHTPMESSPRSPENVAMMSPQIYRSSTGSSAKFKDSECASVATAGTPLPSTHSWYTTTLHTQPVHHYPPHTAGTPLPSTHSRYTTTLHTQPVHHYPPHTAGTPLPSTHSRYTTTLHTQPVHHYPPHTASTPLPPIFTG